MARAPKERKLVVCVCPFTRAFSERPFDEITVKLGAVVEAGSREHKAAEMYFVPVPATDLDVATAQRGLGMPVLGLGRAA